MFACEAYVRLSSLTLFGNLVLSASKGGRTGPYAPSRSFWVGLGLGGRLYTVAGKWSTR
jgi:hypothetical protein